LFPDFDQVKALLWRAPCFATVVIDPAC